MLMPKYGSENHTRSMQSYFTATTTPRYVFMALQETSTSDRGLPDFSSHLLELHSDTNMYDPKDNNSTPTLVDRPQLPTRSNSQRAAIRPNPISITSWRTTYHAANLQNVTSSSSSKVSVAPSCSSSSSSVRTMGPVARRPSVSSTQTCVGEPEGMKRTKLRSASFADLLDMTSLLPEIEDDTDSDTEGDLDSILQAGNTADVETDMRLALVKMSNAISELSNVHQELKTCITHTGLKSSNSEHTSRCERLRSDFIKAMDGILKFVDQLPDRLKDAATAYSMAETLQLAKAVLTKNLPGTKTFSVDVLEVTMTCIRNVLADMLDRVPVYEETLVAVDKSKTADGQVFNFFLFDASVKFITQEGMGPWKQSVPEGVTNETGDKSPTLQRGTFTSQMVVPTRPQPNQLSDKKMAQPPSQLSYAETLRSSMSIIDGVVTLLCQDKAIPSSGIGIQDGNRAVGAPPSTPEITMPVFSMICYLCSETGATDIAFVEMFNVCWRYFMTPRDYFCRLEALYHDYTSDAYRPGKIPEKKGAVTLISPMWILLAMTRLLNGWDSKLDNGLQKLCANFVKTASVGSSPELVEVMRPSLQAILDCGDGRMRRTQRAANVGDFKESESDPQQKNGQETNPGKEQTAKGPTNPTRGPTKNSVAKALHRKTVHKIDMESLSVKCTTKDIVLTLTAQAWDLFKVLEPEDFLFEIFEKRMSWPDLEVKGAMYQRNVGHGARLSEYNSFHDKISQWAGYHIVRHDKLEARSQRFTLVLKLIKECVKRRSYSIAYALYQGITSRYKLHIFPFAKSAKQKSRLDRYEKFFAKDNLKQRMEELHTLPGPCLPIISDYTQTLKDLARGRQIQTTESEGPMVHCYNIDVLKKLTEVILNMEQHHRQPYVVPTNDTLENFFECAFSDLPEDEKILDMRGQLYSTESSSTKMPQLFTGKVNKKKVTPPN